MKNFAALLLFCAQLFSVNSLPRRSTLKQELGQFNNVINIPRISEIIREYWENDPSVQTLVNYLKGEKFRSALDVFMQSQEVDDIVEWMLSHDVNVKAEIEEFTEDISSIHQSSLLLQQILQDRYSMSTFEEEIRSEIQYDDLNALVDRLLSDGNDFAQLYLILSVSRPSLENTMINEEIQSVVDDLTELGVDINYLKGIVYDVLRWN